MTDHLDHPMDESTLRLSRRAALLLGGAAAMTALASHAAAPLAKDGKPFEILFVIYPNGTLQDFVGPNEVFTRIPNTRVRFASPAGGPVVLEHGLIFGASEKLSSIESTDLVCVPGGPDISSMLKPAVLEDLRRLSGSARYVTSVCTGSLILAASGLLKGKRSACHWACLNILKEYGAIPDPARVVQDGSFISGGGVTSGIDFALTVAAEIAGPLAAQTAQLFIEYNPAPPFRAGHPSVAPREVIAAAEKQLPGGSKGLFRLTT